MVVAVCPCCRVRRQRDRSRPRTTRRPRSRSPRTAPPPQVIDVGGPVLTAPRTQPIFFTGDADYADADRRRSMRLLTDSKYWTDHDERVRRRHDHRAADDRRDRRGADLDRRARGDARAASSTVRTPPRAGRRRSTPQTVYSVFLPAGVVVHDPDGDSCDSYGAFHDEAMGAHGESIVYALMPRCDYGNPLDRRSDRELQPRADRSCDRSARRDRRSRTAIRIPITTSWRSRRAPRSATTASTSTPRTSGSFGDFEVQRTWSNAASLAGHNPCVPVDRRRTSLRCRCSPIKRRSPTTTAAP